MAKARSLEDLALVHGELQHVVTVMRQGKTWKSYLVSKAHPSPSMRLIRLFQELRDQFNLDEGIGPDVDRAELVKPFVKVIKMEQTSGEVTEACLSALCRFIAGGLFHVGALNAAAALMETVEAAAHCHFESSDSQKDELVLKIILDVHVVALQSPIGRLISDAQVWNMVQTCLRVYIKMQPPEFTFLLSECARCAILDLVTTLFGSLHVPLPFQKEDLHQSNQEYVEQAFALPSMMRTLSWICNEALNNTPSSEAPKSTRSELLEAPVEMLCAQVIIRVLDQCGSKFLREPAIISVLKGDVCEFVLILSKTNNSRLLSLLLCVFYKLVLLMRSDMKMQIEVLMICLYGRLGLYGQAPKLGDASKASQRLANIRNEYQNSTATLMLDEQVKLILLEGLLMLSKLPWFFREMFCNYDSDPFCSNIFQNSIRILCQHAFLVGSAVTESHYLALRSLQNILVVLGTAVPWPQGNNVRRVLDNRLRKEELSSCVERLNTNFDDGLSALSDAGVTDRDHVVEVLRYCYGVDKQAIGNMLGKDNEFAQDMRERFFQSFNLKNVHLNDALRIILEAARLPKETQQVDRFLESFAAEYHRQNPTMLPSEDVVHILSFSMLILQTDAHNETIKHKMTLEEFIRNHRGIDDGKDISVDVLTENFNRVTQDKMKTSGANEIGRYLWMDYSSRAEHGWGHEYTLCGSSECDAFMFDALWSPVIAVLLVVINDSTEEYVLQAIVKSFISLASLSTAFERRDVLEETMQCLYRISGFAGSFDSRQDFIHRFGSRVQSQMTTILYFDILKRFGSEIRTGWSDAMDVLFDLLRLGLLRPECYELDDFLDGSSFPLRQISFEEIVHRKASSQSLLSAMSSFFNQHEPEEHPSASNKEESRDLVSSCIRKCSPEEILSESEQLADEALLALLHALCTKLKEDFSIEMNKDTTESPPTESKTKSKRPTAQRSLSIKARRCVFFFQLLSTIAKRNADRCVLFLGPLLETCTEVIQTFLNGETQVPKHMVAVNYILEGACVTLLSLCNHFGSHSGVQDSVQYHVQTVLHVKLLARVPPRAGVQVIAGLELFVSKHFTLLNNDVFWKQALDFIAKSCKYKQTYTRCWSFLNFLITTQEPWLREQYVEWLTDAIFAATTTPLCSKRRKLDNFKWIADIMKQSLTLDFTQRTFLLPVTLYYRLIVQEKAAGVPFCLDALQGLLLGPLFASADHPILFHVFRDNVFPIMTYLANTELDAKRYCKARMSATKLMNKVFLQYMDRLSSDEAEFGRLCESLFSLFLRYNDLEPRKGPLSESITESLKNTLLVLTSSGFFEDRDGFACGEQLGHTVWNMLEPSFPRLREEIHTMTHPPVTPSEGEDTTLNKDDVSQS